MEENAQLINTCSDAQLAISSLAPKDIFIFTTPVLLRNSPRR